MTQSSSDTDELLFTPPRVNTTLGNSPPPLKPKRGTKRRRERDSGFETGAQKPAGKGVRMKLEREVMDQVKKRLDLSPSREEIEESRAKRRRLSLSTDVSQITLS